METFYRMIFMNLVSTAACTPNTTTHLVSKYPTPQNSYTDKEQFHLVILQEGFYTWNEK